MPSPALPDKTVIDGAFFQIGRSGIAQVWLHLLYQWLNEGLGEQIVVLDRGHTFPRLPGLQVVDAPRFSYQDLEGDRRYLQQTCDALGAKVFVSTYYSHPLHTPTVLMVHDMIPEVLKWDLHEPMWVQKQSALAHASAYIAVSHNTAQDLRHHLHRPDLPVTVAPNGCDLHPATPEAVLAFRQRLGLTRPYFMLSGSRHDYKNAKLFFEGLASLGELRHNVTVLCTGGGELEPELRALAGPTEVKVCILSDADMVCAYSGAMALVYPSLYEGFGLPVLEAMACACPVICSDAASLPEVGGDAPWYIPLRTPQDQDLAATRMAEALTGILQEPRRSEMMSRGLRQARAFSWTHMADQVAAVLRATAVSVTPSAPVPARLQPRDHLMQLGGFELALPSDHLLPAYRRDHGQYDSFLPTLARFLPRDSVVVDVGANCGDTTCAMAVQRPDLHFVAIEPDARFQGYLTHNTTRLRASHPRLRVDIVQALVGQSGRMAVMQGQGGSKHARFDLVSPGASAPDLVAGHSTESLDNILARTLDQALPAISLIKSDVDGHDHDVLASASQTLAQAQPLVFFECLATDDGQQAAFQALIGQLHEQGWRHFWLFDNYGNHMLETTDVEVVRQMLAYVWRQGRAGVTRTVYYLDILAAPDTLVPLARNAVQAHNAS